TYGDGVADIDLTQLVEHHRQQGVLATITAVQPPGRFGALDVDEDRIRGFQEKPAGDGAWINGGFFVLSPRVETYIDGDLSVWERDPLERLAADGQLASYRHRGYWQMMDTARDRQQLERAWREDGAPWRQWT
ncbi:MAG TPA: sugar phosphate nucleotidyltransferase, partial [Thermoleophilaceae bacterium]